MGADDEGLVLGGVDGMGGGLVLVDFLVVATIDIDGNESREKEEEGSANAQTSLPLLHIPPASIV